MENLRDYRELRVYREAYAGALEIFRITKQFPPEERYSMTDQMRRSSRSVCANLAEAWRKRRYPAHFVSKLNDAESEAAEVRVWLSFAADCGYLSSFPAELDDRYDKILAQLVKMAAAPERWAIAPKSRRPVRRVAVSPRRRVDPPP